MRIALLEDDRDQAEVLKLWLTALECKVSHYETGQSLLRDLKHDHFDLFLLDWQLPDMSGLEVVRWVRQHIDWNVPVIFLTVRNEEHDIIAALEAGADDYIAKPLSAGVTMARIRTVLRRTQASSESREIVAPPYRLDLNRREIQINGELINTTQREFELTAYFFDKIGRVLSRDTLLKEVWGIAQNLNTRTVDTHVSRIRSKLGITPDNGWRLSSIYQYGYRLERLDDEQHTLA